MICLQANQKTSLETLGNSLDSEPKNFREDNMKLMEDQRRGSQLSISNTQTEFTKLIADQRALNESHISSLRNESRENFDRMQAFLAPQFNIISSLSTQIQDLSAYLPSQQHSPQSQLPYPRVLTPEQIPPPRLQNDTLPLIIPQPRLQLQEPNNHSHDI